MRSLIRRHWIVCCGMITVLAFFLGMPVLGALEKASKRTFSVMTYNIWELNEKRPAVKDVVEVVRSEGIPDILLLQEVRGEDMSLLLSSALGLPHHLYRQADGQKYGLAVLSRYPLTDNMFFYFKSSKMGRGALKATATVNDRKVRVCSVHLDRIDSVKVNKHGIDLTWGDSLYLLAHETTDETVRSRSVEELLDWVGSESVIIGGDFNTVFCSKAIRKMGAVFEDALSHSPDYFTGSYLKSGLPVDPRLDFLFHSHDLECLGACVIRRTAGDHYPVRGRFSW